MDAGCFYAARGRGLGNLDVVDSGDDARSAAAQQLMRARAVDARDRAGHGADVAAEGGGAGGDQEGARADACLDDDARVRERGEQSCALHEPQPGRCAAGRDLADEGTVRGDALEQFLVARRVGLVQAASKDSDGLPACVQRASVGGSLDAVCASADDDAAVLGGSVRQLGGEGPARLLDMVEGRSKAVFKQWLADRPQAWRAGVDVVAMDGFTGFKTAAAEELPDAVPVMDPFHVVRLAGDGLDQCRQRVQQATLGHRGRAGDPLYGARRTLHTGAGFLTEKQQARLEVLFATEEHVEVEATWGIYQRIVAAYREPDKAKGKQAMQAVIDAITTGVPAALVEIRRLGRTLKQRTADVLAFFDRPGTSNGPTEAINGRLEHLRGSALGFRNLTNYIARSLLESGGFRPHLHPRLR